MRESPTTHFMRGVGVDAQTREAIEDYGALKEGIHVAGYSFQRASERFLGLLRQDRWKACGFKTVGSFMDSIQLGVLRAPAEQRREVVKEIKRIEAEDEALRISQRQIARTLGVSHTTVQRDIEPGGTSVPPAPEKANAGADEKSPSGTSVPLTESAGSEATAESDAGQADKAADTPDPQPSGEEVAKAAAKRQAQAKSRAEREKQVKKTPPPPKGQYKVIYADPPWRYSFSKSPTRDIENQYPTMSLDEIKAVKVPAADHAVLYLWVTSPKLVEGLAVVDAWGFRYRTFMVWIKDRIGMGYHARQQHESLLICTKGEPGTPEPANRPASIVNAPRGKHSRKPDEFYEIIERAWPDLPRIELFQRGEREGWDGWGSETVKRDDQ